MKRVGTAFIDTVSGETVSYYRDRNGMMWMATGAWSLFRVAIGRKGDSHD